MLLLQKLEKKIREFEGPKRATRRRRLGDVFAFSVTKALHFLNVLSANCKGFHTFGDKNVRQKTGRVRL